MLQELCQLILISLSYLELTDAYIRLESPNIRDGTLTAYDNTDVKITFQLERISRGEKLNTFIFIEFIQGNDTKFKTWCSLSLSMGPCNVLLNNNQSCMCSSEEEPFYFWKSVNLSDRTLWRWRWSKEGKTLDSVNITFNILTAPSTRMTVYPCQRRDFCLVKVMERVRLDCFLENGNLYHQIYLKDRSGKILNQTSASRHITFRYEKMNCQDAGVFHCEATGSQRNASSTLLVECYPNFSDETTVIRNVSVNKNIEIHRSVRMHTKSISRCQINRYNEQSTKRTELIVHGKSSKKLNHTIECAVSASKELNHFHHRNICHCTANGEPPDLNFTAFLYNVTDDFEGFWRMSVFNTIGSGHFTFTITFATNASSPENTDLDPGPIIGSVCAIVVLIAVIIVVIVIVQKRRVRRKSVTKPYESTTPPRSESEKSSSKTNSYSEAGELDPTVRIDEGADDTVTYTIPGAPGAHPRSTRSTAQRSKRGPPQAVPTEQAAREEQPEYIEIENETRHNGEDGYLVPTSQYASLSTTRKSEEGHEYEKFGPKPTGSSSTVEYSGLIKSTKREKHLYDVLEKKETKQTGETGKQDPSRAAVVKKGSGKTSSSVKS